MTTVRTSEVELDGQLIPVAGWVAEIVFLPGVVVEVKIGQLSFADDLDG